VIAPRTRTRPHRTFATLLLLPCLGALVVLGGCPGSLDNPERFEETGGAAPVDCSDVPNGLFKARCVDGPCHNADSNAGSLNLEADGLEARIVDVDGLCMGTLVNTADPASSLVYTKCLDTSSCGSQMPQTGAKLTVEELQCVLDYVSSL